MRTTANVERIYNVKGPLYPYRQANTNPKIRGRTPTERKGTRESLHQAVKKDPNLFKRLSPDYTTPLHFGTFEPMGRP